MELSLEIFNSTIQAIRSDPLEHRKHPRAPFRSKLKILPCSKGIMGKPLEVWTRDISAGGIGVVSPTPLPVGGNFVVRLPQAEGTAVYLLCTVQNCTTLAKTAFVIGSTFAEFAPAPAVPLG